MHAFLSGAQGKAVPSSPRSKAKKTASQRAQRLPWIEKYRPQKVDDIASQKEVVAVLKRCLQSGADVPHFLFYGPPGTGKTSAILAVCRELFGFHFKSFKVTIIWNPPFNPSQKRSASYRDRVLELNASDERGIQVVRERVKDFARRAVDGSSAAPFKVIILDEADCMTAAAQAALRRTMERESRSTRFCLVCNFVSRIIEPLASRCAKFRFRPLDADTQRARLTHICRAENVQFEADAIDALLDVSEGDMRRAVTLLQSAAACVAAQPAGNKPMHENGAGENGAAVLSGCLVRELAAVVPDQVIDKWIAACKSNTFDSVHTAVMEVQSLGFPAYQLMLQLTERVVADTQLTEMAKAVICQHIAICESRLLDGADEYLQNLDLACTMMAQYQCPNK